MLDTHEVVTAIYDQIKTYPDIVESGFVVDHSEYLNMDTDRTPWVGVYAGPTEYAPGSLGRHGASWEARISPVVVVQASHGGDAKKCSERLSAYKKIVLDAIWSDSSLNGTVDMIVSMQEEYSYNNEESESLYYQQVIITLTLEARSG